MAPKILLLNYTQPEADLVTKQTKLRVIRGYVSEGHDVHYVDEHKMDVEYYFPEPYYECSMVFLKLPASDELKAEFKGKTKTLSSDDRSNFRKYWGRRVFVIFAGNTNITNLMWFGIPLGLMESSGIDTTPHSCFGNRNEVQQLTQLLTQQIKMPTARYVTELLQPKDQYTTQDQLYYQFKTNYYPYISNENGDVLAGALSHYGGDYSGGEPGAIVMGLPKKLTTTTIKMIEFLGEHYEIYTPGADWRESGSLYPQNELRRLEDEINDIAEKSRAEVDSRKEKIKAHREQWKYLSDLVTEQSTPLVDAVYRVLTDVVGLTVKKSDTERPTDPVEDLLVEIGERKILVEVKGTKASNPPLDYPQQAITHIRRRGYDGDVEAGLIVNHDMQKDPLLRKMPYSSVETQRVIADVYYIDSRVLLDIAKDVIDGKLTGADAQSTLFGKKGRILYPPEE
jgi:hypothetical protein